MPYDIRNNEEQSRFETVVDGHTAFTQYDLEDPDRIVFTHTEVPQELSGRGIAQQIVRTALEHARDRKLTVVPECQYVATFIKRNPEYEELMR